MQDADLLIWPDNWAPVQVFRRMTTQLIVGGMGGVVGLRYESIPLVLDLCGIPAKDRPETFECLQIMERHMVNQLNDKK